MAGLKLDPLHKYLFPKSFTYFVIRVVLFIVVEIEVSKSAVALMIVGQIVLACSRKVAVGFNEHIKIGGSPLLGFKLYQQLELLNQFTNQEFCSNSVPPVVLFGTSTLILMNYGTIRLYGIVPRFFYPWVPFVNVLIHFFPFTMIPQTVKVNAKSVEFLATARRQTLTKYEKKVVNSLKPVGIRCGQFGMISTSWATKVLDSILNYTATLLLTL
ncbi:hypothetical protein Fcan01_16972 [Folsomia candida]|uniref:Uncharacterized protein n=1 Tax=Folsomia candida TaxID=158441 RepID=A0A226DRT2_FOLCA|nr:hypothetical protein Fcan01_16972 [Folsomia candida]